MPSRRAQQYQVGGSVVGLTARSLSVPTLLESKGSGAQQRRHHPRAQTAMGTLAEQPGYNNTSSRDLRYISNGLQHILLEEEEEENEVPDLRLTKHRSRSSMSSCSAEEGVWQRSSSPAHSNNSELSSPSEIGDSGVSSEHDTPPPVTRHPSSRGRSLRHHHSSDSDSESNVSSDSIPDTFRQKKSNGVNTSSLPWGGALRASGSRRSSSRFSLPSSRSKTTLPEALLNEIREKWSELQQRRSQQGRQGDAVAGRASAQPQWSTSRHTQRRSCPASPSLSRSSSNFPSSLSLFEEDLDTPTRASPVFFENWRHPTALQMAPVQMEDPRSLFECRDDSAGQGFAGLRDIFSPQQESTIKSHKGTVRGVKNRVRAGIATFTSDQRILKHFMDRERGKVVVYITTLGIVRGTYERCLKIRKILWTLLIRFEERDVFMARDTQIQLLDRLHARGVSVPHVFLEGQYLGDAEMIERMNECGELRRLLQPYRKSCISSFCTSCGGFRLLPCTVCNGSKKSVHRNDFTLEFVALKCSSCDESGLVKCLECAEYKEDEEHQEM